MNWMLSSLSIAAGCLALAAPVLGHPDGGEQTPQISATSSLPTKGAVVRQLGLDGAVKIDVLVDASNLGTDLVEVAEITIWPGAGGGPHSHRHYELFYILSGGLAHTINGKTEELKAGDLAIARPDEEVQHRVIGDAPVRMIGIWAAAGEVDDLVERFGFPETQLP